MDFILSNWEPIAWIVGLALSAFSPVAGAAWIANKRRVKQLLVVVDHAKDSNESLKDLAKRKGLKYAEKAIARLIGRAKG